MVHGGSTFREGDSAVIRSLAIQPAILALSFVAFAAGAVAENAKPTETPTAVPATTVKAPPAPDSGKSAAQKPVQKPAAAAKPSNGEVLPWTAVPKDNAKLSPATAAPSSCATLYEAACREAPDCVWMGDSKLDSGIAVKARCDQKQKPAKAVNKTAKPVDKTAAKPKTAEPAKPAAAALPLAPKVEAVAVPASPAPVTVTVPPPVPVTSTAPVVKPAENIPQAAAAAGAKMEAMEAATAPIAPQKP
jgi:DnaK suppressor protein